MKEKIMLHIEAYQVDEYGKKEHVVSLDTIGQASWIDNQLCLEYEETELIGVRGTTTQIWLPLEGDQKVTVKRRGASTLRQVYAKGQKDLASYETPYGRMEIEIMPWKVLIERTDTEISVQLGYDLSVSGQYVGQHHLSIAGKLSVSN
ncbi:MAG: DUF1934 domain-containing protein [Firmicutes bacterium]|nr:DUF1934 domain-containing protein [Bacillota bacterium]MDD4263025.1 DUF1934 domain-containing protein [Bacillota bacterium]MDD4693264.1 DUF1934 domain-containing protein [Bacillota bacterium]